MTGKDVFFCSSAFSEVKDAICLLFARGRCQPTLCHCVARLLPGLVMIWFSRNVCRKSFQFLCMQQHHLMSFYPRSLLLSVHKDLVYSWNANEDNAPFVVVCFFSTQTLLYRFWLCLHIGVDCCCIWFVLYSNIFSCYLQKYA